MLPDANTKHVLIVAGMHRSGTSLLAAALGAAGVDMGERLMPAADGNNEKGFFENLDFVELHEKILQKHALNRFGWTTENPIPVPERLESEVSDVLARNARPGIWGWKDPRTTLFLDYWERRLPNAKFIIIFRPPWEVVDSLFRRGDEIFQADPVLAVHMWTHYNQVALDFAEKFPDKCAVINLDTLAKNVPFVIGKLRERFDFPLQQPKEQLFDEKLLKKQSSTTHWPVIIQSKFPEANDLWLRLKEASLPVPIFDADVETDGEGALRYWMQTRKLERDLCDTNKLLYDVRSELYHASARIQFIEASRIWKVRNVITGILHRTPVST